MDDSLHTRSPATERDAPMPHPRPKFYRYLATTDAPAGKLVRGLYNALRTCSAPAPGIAVKPLLWIYLACRSTYYFCMRVFLCEPIFKAYCKQYGRRLHTGVFIHFVQGRGDIVLGDDVRIDGKCTFTFAQRFIDRPLLQVGDKTEIGHGCEFVVGKKITIGRNCNLSGTTVLFDSNGHPSDPDARVAREAPVGDDVRPIVIGDGVWIGRRCLIFPGVRIGDGSVVSAGSVVRTHVPPFSVVAGNPAKVLLRLKRPDQTGAADSKA